MIWNVLFHERIASSLDICDQCRYSKYKHTLVIAARPPNAGATVNGIVIDTES